MSDIHGYYGNVVYGDYLMIVNLAGLCTTPHSNAPTQTQLDNHQSLTSSYALQLWSFPWHTAAPDVENTSLVDVLNVKTMQKFIAQVERVKENIFSLYSENL